MGTSSTTGEKALRGAGALKAKVERLEAALAAKEEEAEELLAKIAELTETFDAIDYAREGRPFDLWEVALCGVLVQKTRHNLENCARLLRRPVDEIDKLIHWRQVKTRLPELEAEDIRGKLRRSRGVYEEVKLCLRIDFPDPPHVPGRDGEIEERRPTEVA